MVSKAKTYHIRRLKRFVEIERAYHARSQTVDLDIMAREDSTGSETAARKATGRSIEKTVCTQNLGCVRPRLTGLGGRPQEFHVGTL